MVLSREKTAVDWMEDDLGHERNDTGDEDKRSC
jgi:hypothetical protein